MRKQRQRTGEQRSMRMIRRTYLEEKCNQKQRGGLNIKKNKTIYFFLFLPKAVFEHVYISKAVFEHVYISTTMDNSKTTGYTQLYDFLLDSFSSVQNPISKVTYPSDSTTYTEQG
jgi:hypothetical protein